MPSHSYPSSEKPQVSVSLASTPSGPPRKEHHPASLLVFFCELTRMKIEPPCTVAMLTRPATISSAQLFSSAVGRSIRVPLSNVMAISKTLSWSCPSWRCNTSYTVSNHVRYPWDPLGTSDPFATKIQIKQHQGKWGHSSSTA